MASLSLKNLLRTPWGLQGRVQKRIPSVSMRYAPALGLVSRDWFSGFRPGDPAQTNGTCVGRGSMNCAEVLLMHHNPLALRPGEQLDGDRLYLWIRDRYYGDADLDAGAQISDGARALVEAGVLPPDSKPLQIGIDQTEISVAYQFGPIIQGHQIDSQWPNCPANGLILTQAGRGLGGHCTAGLGQWFFEDRESEYCGGNSWGDGWGSFGRYRQTWTRFNRTCVDIWQVRVNPKSMAKWRGYREWIK